MNGIEFSCLSEKGLRDHNEDSCFVVKVNHDCQVFVVIDGVGGEDAGGYAALIAFETFSSYFTDMKHITLDDLKMCVVSANNKIIDMQIIPGLSHMSCVLTACMIDTTAQLMHICHVGDTRLYTLDSHLQMHKITPDHSPVGYLLDSGQISEEEARQHKRRNIISKALGLQRLDFFTDYLFTGSFPVADVQQILLCSDGLHGVVPTVKIRSILISEESCDDTVRTLVDTALKMDSHDNISALSIKFKNIE